MKNWNIQFAISTAKKLNINMHQKHWKVIFCMRSFYKKYNLTPTIRMLLTYMKKKKIFLTSQDLFILFPKGFMKNASQISGLPKNQNCF